MQTIKKINIAKFLSFILLKILRFKIIQIVNRNGVNYKLDLRQGIDLSIFILSGFQKKVTNVLTKIVLNENKKNFFSILDIGSNIGDKSLFLDKNLLNNNFQKFLIYSIEPTEFAINKQKKNLRLNKELISKIKILPIFFTDKKNKIKKAFSSWNLFDKNNQVHGGQEMPFSNSTKLISLDKFIIKNKICNILLIKIDVDGNELDVLYSGKKFLLKNNPYIIMEFSPSTLKEKKKSIKNFYKFIKDMKYFIYDLNLKKLSNNLIVSNNSSIDILLTRNNLN